MKNAPETSGKPSLKLLALRSWTALAGIALAVAAIFSFFLLLAIDSFSPHSNPYIGILAYLVSPSVLVFGISLVVVGILWQRRKLKKLSPEAAREILVFDFTAGGDRRKLITAIAVGACFLLLAAMGSYRSYHFTESQSFCGQSCHVPMEPEYVTYQHSPHARVACTECHIGPGATWYVKAKVNGLRQVYSTLFDSFSRPIITKKTEHRPAQDTCETCHWPQRYVGELDKTYTHYLTDASNTAYSVRMMLNVGGGDPTHGPVGGIHWHMNVGNTVEYIATDDRNQKIPWVRTTDARGNVKEFRTADFKGDPKDFTVRKMDCMDCHNRPAHQFNTPNEAVDLALDQNRIDKSIPFIKKEAVDLLVKPYKTREEALSQIASSLKAKYTNNPGVSQTIAEVQKIYSENFFPEMKADWKAYPDNIGHKDWPGCFRCHDDKHKTSDGKLSIKASDCTSCHSVIAEGTPADVQLTSKRGLQFKHPEEGWEGMSCNDCHSGAN